MVLYQIREQTRSHVTHVVIVRCKNTKNDTALSVILRNFRFLIVEGDAECSVLWVSRSADM
jgi:hypothetical protein